MQENVSFQLTAHQTVKDVSDYFSDMFRLLITAILRELVDKTEAPGAKTYRRRV
jgi:hypothetical protein